MTVTVKSELHPTTSNHLKVLRSSNSESQSDAQIKQLFEQVLKEKNAYHKEKMNWINESTVEITGVSGLALHSFVLRAEELGKTVSYEKKTIIKIID